MELDSGYISFALYSEVSGYFATAHLMDALVDNGKIIEVLQFPMNSRENLLNVVM